MKALKDADQLARPVARGIAPAASALEEIERRFKSGAGHGGITIVKRIPAREARFAEFPAFLPPVIVEALNSRGIEKLYVHQAAAAEFAHDGKNIVVVTPTASGKTLCYNIPILSAMVENPETRALYLFPTKALAQDQLAELNCWSEKLGDAVRTFTYDGDTPQDARKAIRARANLVITNPDMLHTGILPHHTKWERVFENLRYVVIDELHYYRGVLGSHLANVLRRLKRIAAFYGSAPKFICTSATIANPAELASKIVEEDVMLVDDNGAPASEKVFVFYNPPVVNPQLGIRRSYLNETRRLARLFIEHEAGTVVFANSRLAAEILVTYLKQDFPSPPGWPERVRGYRGGYLPRERREIERDLREGRLASVVATNALELGIDIGSLDAAVLAGYPGTIASTWQRAGRAGRRQGSSAVMLVASSAPLDQFMVQNPDYFFGRSPEHGFINPDNLQILLSHLKCAAFELPLREGERFGPHDLDVLCRHLAELGFLHHTSDGWHWISDSYPADAISLRSISSDNFVVVDITREAQVIAEVDFPSALTTLHEKAIYLLNGEQFHVERLDYQERKAYVRECDSEYFTDAISYTKIKVLEQFDAEPHGPAEKSHGEVQVNTQVVGFKKIKFHTMENVGAGELTLPEQEMHTTAFWLRLPRTFLEQLAYSSEERMHGVQGMATAMHAIAILLLMCDARDLGVSVGENPSVRSPEFGVRSQKPDDQLRRSNAELQTFFEPDIYLYDKYPGGIGFSEPLYRMSAELLENARRLIANCPCPAGCPSCVGPVGEVGERGKEVALAILKSILELRQPGDRRDARGSNES